MAIRVVREVECAAPRDAMWLALAETHRFSKALGGQPVRFDPIEGAGAARYLMSTRSAGFELVFEERPFEWRRPEHLVISRLMRSGPLRHYELAFELAERDGGGSRITVTLTATPRSPLLAPILRLRARGTIRGAAALIARIDAQIGRGRPAYEDAPPRLNSAAVREARARLEATVGGDRRALVPRLIDEVLGAPDLEAAHVRPYVVAARWGVERREVLTLCLEAVSAGLLELRWEVICPSCRVAAAQAETLAALDAKVHCHLCDLTSAVDLDRAVEVVLRPARAIRRLPDGPYCIGGPFRTPHVIEQAILRAHGTAVLRAPPEGRCRIYVRGGAAASVDVISTGPHQVTLEAGTVIAPDHVGVAPHAELTVHDLLGEERHVKLEHLEWASLAATGLHVSTLPAFRCLFSGEVLRPGVELAVARMAFLFTDLCGSTAYYTRVGDSRAYAYVHDHAESTAAIAAAHGGTRVKTMGDSVMAAFTDDADALRAAIAIQAAHADVAALAGDGAPGLKVGVHAGPCFAVTRDGRLDYFGQTVNVAQRFEAAGSDGDVIALVGLARELENRGQLGGARVIEERSVTLKGIDAPFTVARLRLDGADPDPQPHPHRQPHP